MKKQGKRLKAVQALYVILLLIAFSAIEDAVSNEATFVYLEGMASWYSEFSPGIKPTTANMEKFDHNELSCAMWGVPFDSVIEVTNLDNGKSIQVRVNDRGPAKRLCVKGRVIDLTMEAFRRIEDLKKGLTRVRVKVLG